VKVKEEMASLEGALHEASRERAKAVQDLARLKQHLLDKVTTESYLLCIFCGLLRRSNFLVAA
jgi:hypothetical protein